MLAADAEHDLKINATAHLSERGSCQEIKKLIGFVRTCRHPERHKCEAAIPDPAKTIIPVAAATRSLRQRGGSRGHHGAGRKVPEALQNATALQYQIPPRDFVILMMARPA